MISGWHTKVKSANMRNVPGHTESGDAEVQSKRKCELVSSIVKTDWSNKQSAHKSRVRTKAECAIT